MRTSSLDIGKVITDRIEHILPCFPLVAEQGVNYPFCTYQRTEMNFIDVKRNTCIQESINVDINIVTDNYTQSIELAKKVKEELDQIGGTCRGVEIENTDMINGYERYMDGAYVQTLTFRIEVN